MKHTTKSYIVLSLIVLVAVSCGPVTPISSATATLTASPVFTATPTQTLTPVPTITPTSVASLPSSWVYMPPERGSSDYKLRPWTKGDYSFFINSMNEGKLFNSYPFAFPVLSSFYGYEYLLHVDEIDVDDPLVWTIAQMDPVGISLPGMRHKGYFNFLVEKLLNDADVSLDDLSTALKSHGFSANSTILVKDFYGKGKDAFFFDAFDENGYLNIGALFAVRLLDGIYRVDTIRDWQWMSGGGVGRGYSFEGAVDTNRNDFPELLVREDEAQNGPDFKVTVLLYEWDDQAKDYRDSSFVAFDSCYQETCWEVKDTSSDILPAFVVQGYWDTQAECPDLTIQHIYRWNGKEYPLEQTAVLSPSTGKAECLVAWAEAAIGAQSYGWQDDRAIQIISDAVNEWPTAMDKTWGLASRDYFRLRLGIWRDLRGESDEALKVLEPLAATPFLADYPLPSQTARAYLNERKNNGSINACQKANETWGLTIEEGIPDFFDYSMPDKARELLGFASPHWLYTYDFSSICYEDGAIFATAGNLASNTTVNPASWFTGIGRFVRLAKQEDFNGDGMQDWLIIEQVHQDSESSSEWFFFGNLNGFDVYEVDAQLDGLPSSSWHVIQPDEKSDPVYLVQSEESLWIFRVNHDKQVETLVDDYGVTLLQIDQKAGVRIKVSAVDWSYKGEKIKNYVWDAPSQTFVTVVEEYDFESARQKVERIIFQEHNYASAISFIQQFLAEAPTEYLQTSSCTLGVCEYDPQRYYPGMYYLMGVAYEMSGQPEQAARTHYLLWHDYPDSPYALLAQYKLEPSTP